MAPRARTLSLQATHWLDRAEVAPTMAAGMKLPQTRLQMLKLAENDRRMAEIAHQYSKYTRETGLEQNEDCQASRADAVGGAAPPRLGPGVFAAQPQLEMRPNQARLVTRRSRKTPNRTTGT